MSAARKDRLGRGLGALLGDYLEPETPPTDTRRLPLSHIVPNPLQPRREFSADELDELSNSIRENGLLQPLVVRPAPGSGERFELVAGERRLRAVTSLGWDDVPVLIREVDDETLLVLALVENLQREALTPLEEAEGYQTLADTFDMTQAEIARSVGKSRSTVANLLRLLGLPPSIRRMLEAGDLSAGHARALLSVGDPGRASELARQCVRSGWSVREMERRAAGTGSSGGGGRVSSGSSGDAGTSRDPVVRALEEALRETLSTRVRITGASRGKGSITIPFHSTEDFERLFALVTGREASEVVR